MKGASAVASLVALATMSSPTPAPAAFERAPLDAVSAALGGVTALSHDAVFGNPARSAGLVPSRTLEGRFDLSRPFGLSALSEGQVSVSRSSTRWGIGAGARRFGADQGAQYAEREARVVLALARRPASVGLAVRGLEAAGDDFSAVRSVAVDAAFLARPVAGVEVGALLEAACGDVPGDPQGVCRRAAAGAARDFGRSLRATIEVQRRGEDPLAGVVGLTWQPVDALALQAGIRQEPMVPSCGFSLRLAGNEVNVAMASSGALGTTYRVGVRLGPFR